MDDREKLADLIRGAADDDAEAVDRLFAATYADLRQLARPRLTARERHTLLDTTSLVHESYLRSAASGTTRLEDRGHFLMWAGRVMRSVIVDFVRRRSAVRRGGGVARITLTNGLGDGRGGSAEEILRVHDALDEMDTFDARLAQVVELRYFGGLTESEIGQALGVTERTMRRDWEKARLLMREAFK